jgi:cell division protein FtsQ
MSKRLKLILIILGTILAVSYIAFSVVSFSKRGDERACQDLIINIKDSTELKFISDKKIISLLHKNKINPIGIKIKDINLEEIENVLSKHPVIETTECYKTISGKLKINIWQKRPLFRIISNTQNFYLDRHKNKIPLSSDFAAYVPVVTGFNINKDFINNELFDFIVFLRNNEFWDSQFVQIHVGKDNEIELIPRVGNHIILLGTLTGYENKLNKLNKLYEGAFDGGYWNQYSKIDLRYKGQIICTKR